MRNKEKKAMRDFYVDDMKMYDCLRCEIHMQTVKNTLKCDDCF